MTSEPFEILDQALREVEMQSHQLKSRIAELQQYSQPEANRRTLTAEGRWSERRRGERRSPGRATAGRRELPERRLPAKERIAQWHSQLAEVLERSMELNNLKRRLNERTA